MKQTGAKRARGRPGITLADVRAACEQLQREGRVIGPFNVRLVLGRGSFNTIQRHLRTLAREETLRASRAQTKPHD